MRNRRGAGKTNEASGREEGFGSKKTRLNGRRRLNGEMERKIWETATNSEHQIYNSEYNEIIKNTIKIYHQTIYIEKTEFG